MMQRALGTPTCSCFGLAQQPRRVACSQQRLPRQLGHSWSTAAPGGRYRHTAAAQQDSETQAAAESTDDDDDLAIERQVSRNRGRKRRPVPAVSPAQKAAEEAALDPSSDTEKAVLQFLGVFFVLILLEGLILAFSGFLPEAVDNWIVDVLYPSYTPQLAVCFACSTAYGVWKTSVTKK